jgi:hypothetical protein
MSLHTQFPKIIYNGSLVTDITIRLQIKEIVQKNVADSVPYIIQDGEYLETLAYLVYGNVEYYWIIAYMNNIVDPIYDWVLSQKELQTYVTHKYGVGENDTIHHWELDGDTVDSATLGAVAITNFQQEEIENEKNRTIKMIDPRYLPLLLNDVENILENL